MCAQQPVPTTNRKLTAGTTAQRHHKIGHFTSVAILAPVTACLVRLGVLFSPCAELLVAELRGRSLRRVRSKRHYQVWGIGARDLLRSRVFCEAKWRNDHNSWTQHHLSFDTSPWPTADALYDEVNACCSEHERTANESLPQSHEHEHMQIVGKIVELPEILIVQGFQTSESLRTAPARHMGFAETVEVLEFPVVVEHVQPAPVVEYVAPAPAIDLHSTCS